MELDYDDDLNANSTPDYLEDTTAGITDYLRNSIRLYPNPATDVLNIQNGTSKDISDISIYAINGVLVKQTSKAATVGIADLQDGVYIVKVQVDNQVLNYRLIKK